MENRVDITRIEVEQCVLDNDELDLAFQGDLDYYNDVDTNLKYMKQDEEVTNLFKSNEEIVVVPESETDEFIREYIEKDMDSHPENIEEFEHLDSLGDQELEVLPSFKYYEEWYPTYVNGEDSLGAREGYTFYLQRYRKELRDWWFKRKQDKLDGRQ